MPGGKHGRARALMFVPSLINLKSRHEDEQESMHGSTYLMLAVTPGFKLNLGWVGCWNYF